MTGPALLSPEGHDPQSTEQVRAVDPAAKAANLAMVAALGALAGMLAQPIAGLLSDRTRSRFGRRAPWMLAGAVVGAGAMVTLGGMHGLAGILALYLLLNVALNLYLGPKTAVMPDRAPRGVRGVFSAFGGLGVLIGSLGGTALGAAFAEAPLVGYCVLAVVIVLAAAGFVLFNPDHDNRDASRPPMHWTQLLRTFWVNPAAHPDFAWGFLGRLLTFTGYYLTANFQLYLLQDYVGLEEDAVDLVPVLALIALGGTLVSTVVGGPLSDRLGRRKPIAVAAGLLIASAPTSRWTRPCCRRSCPRPTATAATWAC